MRYICQTPVHMSQNTATLEQQKRRDKTLKNKTYPVDEEEKLFEMDSESERLKNEGNSLFKSGNYLKAAAVYTQAIKKDPQNPTLFRSLISSSLLYLHLIKLSPLPDQLLLLPSVNYIIVFV